MLKLVNRATGKLILEEDDNGNLKIHDKSYREAVENQQLKENNYTNKPDKTNNTENDIVKTTHEKLHSAYNKSKAESLIAVHQQIVLKMKELGLTHEHTDELDKTLEG